MKHLKDEMILKAEDLYFSYDDDHNHSLNGLSLEIKKGRKIAVMGANGSGKSTFFLCCPSFPHRHTVSAGWLLDIPCRTGALSSR